jgi:hypothetical protein
MPILENWQLAKAKTYKHLKLYNPFEIPGESTEG